MTWAEVSDDNWQAANLLNGQGHHRSSISRAYYAAFAAATDALTEIGARFAFDREGPSHARLPEMIFSNLGLNWGVKYEARKALVRLYKARVDADYRTDDVDEINATMALKDANFIRRSLGT